MISSQSGLYFKPQRVENVCPLPLEIQAIVSRMPLQLEGQLQKLPGGVGKGMRVRPRVDMHVEPATASLHP